uniref:Protein krueppel n=1 Tax=Glossina brevipalpis TaxID=37001 RepID=A0A1A9W702_9MUSC
MDIEKICRTCLTLSGPLLSIYDGGKNGSGCLADMLREFTKTKPQSNDNLPERVCLSCISEINRCYSFKLKCENSSKTLEQLIPNALKCLPVVTGRKVVHYEKAVQTNKKEVVSTYVQTFEERSALLTDKEIQTEIEDPSIVTMQNFKFDNAKQIRRSPESPNACIANRKRSTDFKLEESVQISSNQKNPEKICNRMCFDNNLEDASFKPSEMNREEAFILLNNNSAEDNKFYIRNEADNIGAQDSINVVLSNHFEFYDDENELEEENQTEEYDYTCGDVDIPDINCETDQLSAAKDIMCKIDKSFDDSPSDEDSHGRDKEKAENSSGSQLSEKESELATIISSNRIDSNREEYRCPYCIMTFVSLKTLRRHLSKRHNLDLEPSQIIVEKKAKKSLKTIEELIDESLSNEQDIVIKGNVLKPRLMPRDRVSTPKVVETTLTSFQYFCDYCKAGFALRKTLTLHMNQNLCTSNNFKCDNCGKIFLTEKNLEAHIATHTNEQTCLECKKTCGSIEELSAHMIDEHNRNPRNQCNVCKKVFTMKTSLMDHMRIHSGEKPFLCTICGKSFRQNSNLRQHLMRHTNEKNFKCDVCLNAYVTKAELFSHKRSHTGDHPFNCEICGSRFTSSSSLQKHRRKHTGERPYACEFCPMRFTALNILKNHRRTHTGEKPFKCEHCNKSFSQKGDCQMHQRTHGEKDFSCVCGAKFSKSSNLRYHRRRQHCPSTDGDATSEQDVIDETEMQITLMEDEDGDELITISAKEEGKAINEHRIEISTQNEEELLDIAMEAIC